MFGWLSKGQPSPPAIRYPQEGYRTNIILLYHPERVAMSQHIICPFAIDLRHLVDINRIAIRRCVGSEFGENLLHFEHDAAGSTDLLQHLFGVALDTIDLYYQIARLDRVVGVRPVPRLEGAGLDPLDLQALLVCGVAAIETQLNGRILRDADLGGALGSWLGLQTHQRRRRCRTWFPTAMEYQPTREWDGVAATRCKIQDAFVAHEIPAKRIHMRITSFATADYVAATALRVVVISTPNTCSP